jgi:hypothetical protein
VDEVVQKAVELLLGAGWRGALAALVLVVAYVLARQAIKSLPKPTPGPPPTPPPDAEWGDNVKPEPIPDELPKG